MTVKDRLRKALTFVTLSDEAKDIQRSMVEERRELIELMAKKTDYPAADCPIEDPLRKEENRKRVMSA